MVLLVLIGVGLLQLSAVTLRTSGQGQVLSEARANARVALMLAMGQLQLELGPDRRISSPSGILDSSPLTPAYDGVAQPHFTGVWDATESPFIKKSVERPSYDKKVGFRSWLISGDPTAVRQITMVKADPATGTELCILAADGKAPSSTRGVTVPFIKGPHATFAWWTSDDGVKATLHAGETPDAKSKGKALLAMRRSEADGHAAIDSRLPNRTNGLDQRIVDLATVDAAVPSPNDELRIAWKSLHDLTTRSETVPVDVTTGALRKCMNLRLDWLGAQSAKVRAGEGTVGIKISSTMDYRLFSWDQLRNYESIARSSSMMTLKSGRPTVRSHKQSGFNSSDGEPEWDPNIGDNRFRLQPVLLKLSYVVSYASERIPNPVDPAKPLALRLYLYPMAVLWNPYNVDLIVPEYCVTGFCPLVFDINKGSPTAAKVDLTQNQSGTMLAFGQEMGGAEKLTNLVIPAGATKVLYPQEVRWQNNPTEHRHSRFIWHYYMWAQAKKFSLGDSNFGGIIKNLRGNQSTAYFSSQPTNEICGAAGESIRVEVTPSTIGAQYTYGLAAAHTDWWGNNGSGTDSASTLQKFGTTTSASFKVETNSPQISLIKESETPARTFGQLEGRPTPLLYYECYRKAADEKLFPSKSSSFSVAGNSIHGATSSDLGTNDMVTPWFENPYSFRFKAVNSWFDVTKEFQLPPDRDDRVYFGASYSPKGQLNVIDQEIPVTPLVSLAQLQHLPLFDFRPTYDPETATATTIWYGGDYGFHEGRETQFAQNHAIGNSYASPGIPAEKINYPGWKYTFNISANHLRVDRSYIANTVLWDTWFCSTIGSQDGKLLTLDVAPRKARKVAEDFLNGTTPAPNDAMQAHPDRPVNDVLSLLFDAAGNPTKDAYLRIAEYLRIQGSFNVNSVSEEAWTQFLSGLFSRPHLIMESVTGLEQPVLITPAEGSFLVARNTLGNAQPAELVNGAERNNRYWNGSRELTATQIRELAIAIVQQVKKRGPFLSLAEFINRRVTSDTSLAVSGALQSALDDSSVSINAPFRSDMITGTESTTAGKPKYPFPIAAQGPRRQGCNGYVTQADLLQTIGPLLTPRSDTFTIRATGESRDGNGIVLARATCEAVVQRSSAYVDSRDAANVLPANLKQRINTLFGRRFNIVSFRWLQPSDLQ